MIHQSVVSLIAQNILQNFQKIFKNCQKFRKKLKITFNLAHFSGWVFFWVTKSNTSDALCVIFTILVSFSRGNALFASKAKINVF